MSELDDLREAWDAERDNEACFEIATATGVHWYAHRDTADNLIAALTARNATLERALADVERDVTRPVGIDVTGYYDGAEADLYRKAWHEGADAVRADINKTLRTILAGAKEENDG